jgi:hypothetical protein
MSTIKSGSAAVALTLAAAALNGTAAGKEMNYRRDAAAVPGYNTGTGRFVDEDRRIAIEVDTVAPATAGQTSSGGNKADEWGAELQFNLLPVMVGTEFWFGEYKKQGVGSGGAALSAGESYDILYNRFQAFVGMFSRRQQMKGWYGKFGYSYVRIDAETNLASTGSATYANIDETRHGPSAAAGYRFSFLKNRVSLNTGVAYAKTLNREVDGNGADVDPRYQSILANAGTKQLDRKDFPQLRVGLGVLF